MEDKILISNTLNDISQQQETFTRIRKPKGSEGCTIQLRDLNAEQLYVFWPHAKIEVKSLIKCYMYYIFSGLCKKRSKQYILSFCIGS